MKYLIVVAHPDDEVLGAQKTKNQSEMPQKAK